MDFGLGPDGGAEILGFAMVAVPFLDLWAVWTLALCPHKRPIRAVVIKAVDTVGPMNIVHWPCPVSTVIRRMAVNTVR